MNKKEYSVLYAEIPEPFKSEILTYGVSLVNKEHVVYLEKTPHVTVKYGIVSNDILDVARAIRPIEEFTIEVGNTSMFMADDYRAEDVIKLDISSEYLNRLNKRITDNMEVADTYKTYTPHCTVAYVAPGSAMLYLDKHPFAGRKVTMDYLVFVPKTGEKGIIDKYGRILHYK